MRATENNETTQTKKVSKRSWMFIMAVALLILLGVMTRAVKKNNVYKAGHETFQSLDSTFVVDYPRTWEVQVGNRGAIEATFVNKDKIQVD